MLQWNHTYDTDDFNLLNFAVKSYAYGKQSSIYGEEDDGAAGYASYWSQGATGASSGQYYDEEEDDDDEDYELDEDDDDSENEDEEEEEEEEEEGGNEASDYGHAGVSRPKLRTAS